MPARSSSVLKSYSSNLNPFGLRIVLLLGLLAIPVRAFSQLASEQVQNDPKNEASSGGVCYASAFFVAGPPMTIVKNIRYFPKDSVLENYMRPGDVIGISLYVVDTMNFVANCMCTDQNPVQQPGAFFGKVGYHWSMSGPGTLIQPSKSSERNSVMYQIPLCPSESTIVATLTCVVSDDSTMDRVSQALDNPLTGTITITTEYHPKRYLPSTSGPVFKAWLNSFDPLALRVKIKVDSLKPQAPKVLTLTPGSACSPSVVMWEALTPIDGGFNIQEDTAADLCPAYLTLLSCERFDTDRFRFTCSPNTDCTPSDGIRHITDPLFYKWSLVNGGGEFPLGTDGPCVVFRRSRSSTTQVKCVITDSQKEGLDSSVALTYTVSKSMKPKAFVAVGDDVIPQTGTIHMSNRSKNPKYPNSDANFEGAAQLMLASFQKLGYDTTLLYHADLGSILKVLHDPCNQAMCICAHGTSDKSGRAGAMALDTTDKQLGNIQVFSNSDVAKESPFGCQYQPLLREVDLLGCSTLKANWYTVFPNAVVEGYSKDEETWEFAKTAQHYYRHGGLAEAHDLSSP